MQTEYHIRLESDEHYQFDALLHLLIATIMVGSHEITLHRYDKGHMHDDSDIQYDQLAHQQDHQQQVHSSIWHLQLFVICRLFGKG
jgi:hypothetical protein